jgi:hypothetical protein
VLRLYFQDVGDASTRTLMAQTPDATSVFPIETVGSLDDGVGLNKGLYVVMPGYSEYIAAVKDKSRGRLEVVGELEMLDPLSGPGTIIVDVTMVVAGKKKM